MTKIPKALLRRAVDALRESASLEAGLSQGECLVTKEETQAWQDAKQLVALLREAGDMEIGDEE